MSCWAAPTRSCTRCASSGSASGDTIAFVLPNSAEVFEIYLAAMQAGWYIVPINHHLVAPEIAYIVKDSGAQVFIGHERFADACLDATEEAEIPASRCLAVGEIPGFASYAQLRDNQKTDRPADRSLGDTMNYTSGTHRATPKGVRRALSGADPDEMAIALAGILLLFGISPGTTTCTSWALRCTTPPCCASPARRSTWVTPWC